MTGKPNDREQEKIIVSVDEDLEDLIPGFLENRQADIVALKKALTNDDFESIRVLGHSMKGAGGGYGFDEISEIGSQIEEASKVKDAAKVLHYTERLKDYLDRVTVIFEEEGS